MLVSAFIGYDQAMSLYQTAISNQYRFFSYGDVSLLLGIRILFDYDIVWFDSSLNY